MRNRKRESRAEKQDCQITKSAGSPVARHGKCSRRGGYKENEYRVRLFESSATPDRDTHSTKANQQDFRAKLGNRTSESGKNGPCGQGLPTSDAVGAGSNVSAHFSDVWHGADLGFPTISQAVIWRSDLTVVQVLCGLAEASANLNICVCSLRKTLQ